MSNTKRTRLCNLSIVIATFIFTTCFMAMPARAATVAEMQAQINALMAQIAALSSGSQSSYSGDHYGQSSYYTYRQGSYYGQSNYYSQSSYGRDVSTYSQSSYTSGNTDKLTIKKSAQSPDASTMVVESESVSDFHDILAFTLDTTNNKNAVEVEEMYVRIKTNDAGGTDDVVADAQLMIEGKVFGSLVVGQENTKDTAYAFVMSESNDMSIAPGQKVEVVLQVAFKGQKGNYTDGTTISTIVDAKSFTVDGLTNELTQAQLYGKVSGERHTLRSAGPIVALVDTSETAIANSDASLADDEGRFESTFAIGAIDTDLYIPKTLARGGANTGVGVNYRIVDSSGAAVAAGTAVAMLESVADVDGNYFVVNEGEEEEFTVSVEYDPKATGTYKMQILSINWSNSMKPADKRYLVRPIAELETNYLYILGGSASGVSGSGGSSNGGSVGSGSAGSGSAGGIGGVLGVSTDGDVEGIALLNELAKILSDLDKILKK